MGKPEIAVIGGGIAGMIAALEVARLGGSPTLYEATPRLGGRAQTRELDGFYLNQGPHALYLAGALCAALADFDVKVSGRGPDLPNGLAVWSGATYPFPLRQTGRSTDPLDAADSQALAAFFTDMANDAGLGLGVPLREAVKGLPARAAMVIAALVRLSTYVDRPDEIDGKAALDQLRLSFAGTIYVDGGWRTLVEGLALRTSQAGVTIKTGDRVSSLNRAADGSIRVEARSGSARTFSAAILAVPPHAAQKMLPTSQNLAAAVAATCPVRLMSLDLALSQLPNPEATFALGFDEPTYLSVHSDRAALAPTGGALVHVAHYLRPGEQANPDLFARIEGMADSLQPGWRSAIVHEQRLSGTTVAFDFPRYENGGTRAEVALTDSPGVYLAGDWVGGMGMLADAAAASAYCAARSAYRFCCDGSATSSVSGT